MLSLYDWRCQHIVKYDKESVLAELIHLPIEAT